MNIFRINHFIFSVYTLVDLFDAIVVLNEILAILRLILFLFYLLAPFNLSHSTLDTLYFWFLNGH